MLTKTLRFDGDVLDVLRAMKWADDGLSARIDVQLNRDLYERVNKALVAMGGKWARSAKAHLFKTDPRQSVEGLIANGTLVVEKDGFFETPLAVVKMMLDLVAPVGLILEPEGGLGAIVDNLGIPKTRIICIEKNQQRADVLKSKGYRVFCEDFLECKTVKCNTIYMNPPFEAGQDIDHVKHAYSLLRPGGEMVSVMSTGAFFRNDKKAKAFRDWFALKKGIDVKLPSNSFKESGTGVNACLVVLKKSVRARSK